MERISLNIRNKNNIARKHNGQSYSIIPYISLESKQSILEELYSLYNKRIADGQGVLPMICGIMLDLDYIILHTNTNILVDQDNIHALICSGIMDTVKKCIVNYEDIRRSAMEMIQIFTLENIISDVSTSFENTELGDVLKNKTPEQISEITNLISNIKTE